MPLREEKIACTLGIKEGPYRLLNLLGVIESTSKQAIVEPVVVQHAQTRAPYALELAESVLSVLQDLDSDQPLPPNISGSYRRRAARQNVVKLPLQIPSQAHFIFRCINAFEGTPVAVQLEPVIEEFAIAQSDRVISGLETIKAQL